jgi:diguanylate cyclase (GGDEF)-like protein
MDMNDAYSLMYIDVDHLAAINELFGRSLGDSLLDQLDDRLKTATRSENILVRLSSDEFMLLLASQDANHLCWIAQMLLARARDPMRVGGRIVETSISIGAALHPLHGRDIVSLMRCAEFAMRQVKANGRNGYHLFSGEAGL